MSDNHAGEELVSFAKPMFLANEFSDKRLDGPPQNASTPQPGSKEEIRDGLQKVKLEIDEASKPMASSTFEGKCRHFALGYLSAGQWLQLADMHLRHHLRQKSRIDSYLKLTHSP